MSGLFRRGNFTKGLQKTEKTKSTLVDKISWTRRLISIGYKQTSQWGFPGFPYKDSSHWVHPKNFSENHLYMKNLSERSLCRRLRLLRHSKIIFTWVCSIKKNIKLVTRCLTFEVIQPYPLSSLILVKSGLASNILKKKNDYHEPKLLCCE